MKEIILEWGGEASMMKAKAMVDDSPSTPARELVEKTWDVLINKVDKKDPSKVRNAHPFFSMLALHCFHNSFMPVGVLP